MKIENLASHIDAIADFPKKGILFRDLLPILRNPSLFKSLIESMSNVQECAKADALIAIDARGFLFGSPLSLVLNKPLVVARKPNKLPGKLISKSYDLEYGNNSLSLQENSINSYNTFAIIDDLLATGGTVNCLYELLKQKNKHINCLSVVVELSELKGREKFNFPTFSQISY